MRRKKKTRIVTFESHERMTIRRSAFRMIAWCERCAADVEMVTPNEAAALGRFELRAIFRKVESGQIHSIEADSGALMICRNSLFTLTHGE